MILQSCTWHIKNQNFNDDLISNRISGKNNCEAGGALTVICKPITSNITVGLAMSKLDWKSYEELVKDIYEQLGKATGVKILGYGNECKIVGKSGVRHQIDVLTSLSDGLHDHRTAIECKFWDKKVNKNVITNLKEIIDDCRIEKGVVVSKIGFTPDAVKMADELGVGLVELRVITDEDWRGRIRKIIVHIHCYEPAILYVHFTYESTSDEDFVTENDGMQRRTDLIEIVYPDGKSTPFNEFLEAKFFKEIKDLKPEEMVTKTYTLDKGTKVRYLEEEKSFLLHAVEICGGFHKTMVTQDVIDGDDQILYYMKCIFENMELTINKDGKIVKQTI